MMYKRGEILVADLGEGEGSEQGGERYVVVISNDVGNRFAPTVIVVSLTSQIKNMHMPTHVKLNTKAYKFLSRDSIILAEQIRTLDKRKIRAKVNRLNETDLDRLNNALKVSIAV